MTEIELLLSMYTCGIRDALVNRGAGEAVKQGEREPIERFQERQRIYRMGHDLGLEIRDRFAWVGSMAQVGAGRER